MKVPATGGAGFIGSHVADALLKEGRDVHVMDDFSTGKEENVGEGVTLHRLDIRSPQAGQLLQDEEFDVLVHHAAQMDVRRSVAQPGFDADVNVLGFLNLMEAGRASGLRKVVFASTGGAIYGEPEYTPQDVHHPLKPISPYGITKLVTEKYLYFYEQQYGIGYAALRYANVYGPRQNPHGEAGVIAIFAERLLAGRQAVIYGDGRQTRDYVFVSDVVRANLLAVTHEESGAFNIGTETETDVNELYRRLRKEIAPDAAEKHAEPRAGEQQRSVLGVEVTSQTLGWAPEVDLDEGLRRTVDWFQIDI